MADHGHDLVRAERDLYRRLLDPGDHDDLAAFLDEALALVVEATGALRGYLSLDPTRDGEYRVARVLTG